ncbi:peptidase C39 family protein [Candidatus Woesearchaeota archaeon]|nr:peptidase C39 family protein [Candidatus Woesearchaeota archaeon]
MQAYKQTTQFTGAASALLMVMNHFDQNFKLTQENEFRIWLNSVNLPTRACSIYGLAGFSAKHNINVKIVVGKKEYEYPDYRFKGYKKEEVDAAKFTEKLHLSDLKQMKVEVEERDFSLKEVNNLLSADKIVMLRLDTGVFRDSRPSSNYVVLTDFNKNYTAFDPHQGEIKVTKEQMDESFNDLVTKRKRDHRMLVFG